MTAESQSGVADDRAEEEHCDPDVNKQVAWPLRRRGNG